MTASSTASTATDALAVAVARDAEAKRLAARLQERQAKAVMFLRLAHFTTHRGAKPKS